MLQIEGPRVIVVGDVHGKSMPLTIAIDEALEAGASSIVQVGDFEVYRSQYKIGMLSEKLMVSGVKLYFLPGNHEDWPYLNSIAPNCGDPVMVAPGITYMPVGTRGMVGEASFAVAGGAVSVNREKLIRTPGLHWYPEEEIAHEDAVRIASGGAVDILFTHDCPDQYDLPLVLKGDWDEDMIARSHEYRDRMALIAHGLEPKLTVHGHHHMPYHDIAQVGTRGDSVVVGMDMEFRPGARALLDTAYGTVRLHDGSVLHYEDWIG